MTQRARQTQQRPPRQKAAEPPQAAAPLPVTVTVRSEAAVAAPEAPAPPQIRQLDVRFGALPKRHYHQQANVRTALRDWLMEDWRNAASWLRKPNGGRYDWLELKVAFGEALKEGASWVPLERCSNWSDTGGCMGHDKL